jgi:outer membrane lipase/esterase
MKKLIMIALITLVSACSQAFGATFSHLYVAGDSMSDTGRRAMIEQLFSTNYYNQLEASNGPLWPEQLMASLGKVYQQGDNQAFGGAATYTSQTISNGLLITRPGLIDQINSFQLLDAAHSVFIIWIGHNDIARNLDDADSALATIKQGVALLRQKRAKRIVVLGVSDVAAEPAGQRGPDVVSAMDAVVLRFNAALQQYVQQKNKQWEGKLQIRYVDTFSLLNSVRATLPYPDGNGWSDPMFVCCHDWSAGNAYGYWDGVHPTTYEHGQLAQRIKAVIGRMK